MSRRHRIPGTTRRTLNVLYLVPSPDQPGLTPAERVALTLRRDATITGHCICGATFPPIHARAGQVTHIAMTHQPDCPAADGPHLDALVHRLGDDLRCDPILVKLRTAA